MALGILRTERHSGTSHSAVGGAVLLLIPRTAALGFILVGCTMVGAVAFWIFTNHAFGAIIPGALLVVIVGVGWNDNTVAPLRSVYQEQNVSDRELASPLRDSGRLE
ncbi:MAG TPA: hypothetical protein VGJ29_17710 [Vicinamibacterales bacterium]